MASKNVLVENVKKKSLRGYFLKGLFGFRENSLESHDDTSRW